MIDRDTILAQFKVAQNLLKVVRFRYGSKGSQSEDGLVKAKNRTMESKFTYTICFNYWDKQRHIFSEVRIVQVALLCDFSFTYKI